MKIEQSPDASFNPSSTSTFLSVSVPTSGGNGSSPFTINPGMTSFFLRANYTSQGLGVKTGYIQVNISVPPPPPGMTQVTIDSAPASTRGLPNLVQVDGTNYVTPQTFNWATGSGHMIAANNPAGYVFQSWSDGGNQTHTITVPATPTTYTANYTQSPPPTPITRIQFARGTASSGLTIPVSIAPPVNGNTLIAVIGLYSNGNLTVSPVNGITQTGANWVRDVSKQTGNGNGDVEIWRASNVQNAGPSVTITLTGSGTLVAGIAEVCEYSGLTNTNPLDLSGTNTGVSGSPTIGTMPTTSQAKELWIAGITHLGNDTQTNPTNGFIFTDPGDGVATNNMSLGYLEYIASSPSTPSTGVTVSSNYFAACIATYRGS